MDHIRSTSDFMDFRVLKHCLFGIRVVGNTLFFAELFKAAQVDVAGAPKMGMPGRLGQADNPDPLRAGIR